MKSLVALMILMSCAASVAVDETCAQYGNWVCVIIDGCDKPHKGEALCKTHAVSNAKKSCLLNSDEPETCNEEKATCDR